MILYTATCLFGLEGLLGEEIDNLGYKRVETMDGRITFEGDEKAIAKANICLRFAERLFINMGSFEAKSFEDLFEGTKDIEWEEYISKNDQFPVKGHSIKSSLFSIPDCQKIIKKAIATRLGQKYGLTVLPENNVKYQIEFFIFKDRATLMIDTSGVALHKRGYRPETIAAPLRETLAAALAKLSRPREDVLFWDPFCGSGTIAIEASMIMKNIMPGMNRSFISETFPMFDTSIWNETREEAIANIKNTSFEAYASDIDEECVNIAKTCAKRAEVDTCVKVFKADARDITSNGRKGTIVTNPPYGERLLTKDEADVLYKEMGVAFSSLDKWQIYVLTPNELFPKLYGRRPDKVRKLYNGMIPCFYYQFFKNK